MEHESNEEDDEQMVGVPEHLEVRPADHLHGRRDDEDEGQRDGDARQPGDGGEHDDGRILHQNTVRYFTDGHFLNLNTAQLTHHGVGRVTGSSPQTFHHLFPLESLLQVMFIG